MDRNIDYCMLDSKFREKILLKLEKDYSKSFDELKELYNFELIDDKSEKRIWKIFEEKAEALGFKNIKPVDNNPELTKPTKGNLGPGDYVAEKDDQRVRIEIETGLPQFFTHKKEIRDMIDVVIAFDEGWGISNKRKNRLKELEEKEILLLNNELDKTYVPRLNFWSFLYKVDKEFRKILDVKLKKRKRKTIEKMFD